jgi:DNA-binding transcriptional ArsR family regulator
VRVRIGRTDELAVRVAISPMATVLSSIFEALLGVPRGAPESWYRYVRQEAGDLAAVFRPIYRSGARAFPEFVAPNPIAPRASFEDELAAMRAAPPEQVRRATLDLFGAEPPPGYRSFVRDPGGALAALVDRLAEYWSRVFEPVWRTMESVLEREVLTLGSRLVSDGAAALLVRLHPRITFADGTLRWASQAMAREVDLRASNVLVVPMLSGPDAILSSLSEELGAVIAYAAPGTSVLWQMTGAPADGALRQLLGATSARVMLAVAMPATTGDVAHQLNISPALASHHLKGLSNKGLVDGARFGRRVYYQLTPRGKRLREAVED